MTKQLLKLMRKLISFVLAGGLLLGGLYLLYLELFVALGIEDRPVT